MKPARWSSTTIDTKRTAPVSRLLDSWNKVPTMRLGELLAEALADAHLEPFEALRRLDDEALIEVVERYVLTKAPSTST